MYDLDFSDLEIKRISRRLSVGGSWVIASVLDGQYKVSALVFPEHSSNPAWEISQSRISKLCVRRKSDGKTTYNWDRGADVEPAADDAVTKAIVDFICAGLADLVYHE